jgi:hypothetical protein
MEIKISEFDCLLSCALFILQCACQHRTRENLTYHWEILCEFIYDGKTIIRD